MEILVFVIVVAVLLGAVALLRHGSTPDSPLGSGEEAASGPKADRPGGPGAESEAVPEPGQPAPGMPQTPPPDEQRR